MKAEKQPNTKNRFSQRWNGFFLKVFPTEVWVFPMTNPEECQPTVGFPNKWVFPKKGHHPKNTTAKEDTYPDKHQREDRRHRELPNRGAEISPRKVENRRRPAENNDRLKPQESPEELIFPERRIQVKIDRGKAKEES